jgi:thiamine-phosphate pyrophosphorylase
MSAKSAKSAEPVAPEQPQIYLITPPAFDLETFPALLSAVLDAREVACLRLSLATKDETTLLRTADRIRTLAHERDLAIVIDTHVGLVERLGLDGVHLGDGPRSVRKTRADLGPDAIVGAYCGTTRHDGMAAAEQGADYASFGPIGPNTLGDGSRAEFDLFAWWSEVIEVPIVAEGALDVALIEALAPLTDFFAIGEEIWATEDPVAAMKALTAPLR